MDCWNCGSAVRSGAKFCPKCGIALEKRNGACPNCRRAITFGMRFCRFCGISLDDVFCPLCQRPNRPNVKFCAQCGALMANHSASDPFGTGKLPPGVILAGRYLILSKIAQGGMGAVYEAKEVPTGVEGRLAIKEMSFSLLNRLQEDQRHVVLNSFRREYELLSKLNHPNLVRVNRFFEEMGRQYFVMEFIEGQTLERILEKESSGGFLPLERVMQWAWQLSNVLHYLHSQTPQIIYRDLKPSNVMEIGETGLIKLFDFGIARYYKPGQKSDTVRFGTDGYLAPEIIAYQTQTSERTDVYAFGAMLHQLLTRYDPQFDPWRRPPIRSINPNIPDSIAFAIESALILDPAKRIPNVKAFFEALFGKHARLDQALQLTDSSKIEEKQADEITKSAGLGAHLRVKKPQDSDVLSAERLPQPLEQEQSLFGVTLNLGAVPKGISTTGYFEVAIPPSTEGQVRSTVSWLVPEPDKISTQNSRVAVHASTSQLKLAKWDEVDKPNWFTRIPGFFRVWLGFHSRYLLSLPARHAGEILIYVTGSTTTQINVTIQVHPPSWMVFIGWMVTLGLMLLEIAVFLVPLLFVLVFLF